jgi:hypothetical protein
VAHLDLPPLVIQLDQVGGRDPVMIQQRGHQPVPVLDTAAVCAGDARVGFDDPHG